MLTQILVLAAGVAKTIGDGHAYPAFLAETDGVTVLEKIVANTANLPNSEHIFAFRESEMKRYRLDNIAKNISTTSKVVAIPDGTLGSACTAMFVASQLDQAAPLLIMSANELVEANFESIVDEFSQKNVTAGTVAFRSTHPRYSYVKLDESGNIVEAAQQNPISNLATTGIFYFKTTDIFVNSAKSMILKNAHTEGNFYIAPVFNEIILANGSVAVSLIDKSQYNPLKTEKHILLYEQGISA
jgi:dTDP-glucose pyrophosphorylase